MFIRHLLAGSVLLTALSLMPAPARSAQSYDNCTGFIDSLPAVIETQGTWCLRKDLSTAITGSAAIDIRANNVTLDCNDFKLGGLPAGAYTDASGVAAIDRFNVTVRRCNIRGFYQGTNLWGGGHVVEDNRLDGNTSRGLSVFGDGSVVRRNLVRDTGGSTLFKGEAVGIYTSGDVDVLDNTITGVLPVADIAGYGSATGIYAASNNSGSISNNRVRNLVPLGTGAAFGIAAEQSFRVAIRSNDVTGPGVGVGIACFDTSGVATDNVVGGFAASVTTCTSSNNTTNP